jgi:site-specific DNA-methyltransferase (adenine-specific)
MYDTIDKIYNEDCLKFMKNWTGKKVDVIVTSPPYNLKKKYSYYYDNKQRQDYLNWMYEVANSSKKILSDNGSFFLNIVGKPSDQWLAIDVAKEFGKEFFLQNTIHWIKSIALNKKQKGTTTKSLNGDLAVGHFKPINTDRYLNQCHEYIFHFTKKGDVKLDKLAIGVPYAHESNLTRWKTKNKLRDRGNAWFISYENKQGAFYPIEHPAEFPEKLPYLCIKLHGVKKDTLVYDPFMGLGNTALACIRLGVHYIGTEIDARYIAISDKKIAQRKQELAQTILEV